MNGRPEPPGQSRRWRLRAGVWLPPTLAVAVLLVVWEVGVAVTGVPAYILPRPSEVWTAFGQVRPLLGAHIVTTSTEALLGVVTGALLGVVLAVAVWAVPLLRRMVYPLLVASQTVPMIVLAPLLVLWFGFGLTPKVVIVALITLFPVAVSTVQGLAGADPEQIDLLRSMGARRSHILRMVLVPAATPAFFAGLRIAAAYAIAGAVIGEWVGASSGLGLFLTRSQTSFRVDRVFVGVAVIAVLSVILFGAVDVLGRLAAPWQRARKLERPARRGRAAGAAAERATGAGSGTTAGRAPGAITSEDIT